MQFTRNSESEKDEQTNPPKPRRGCLFFLAFPLALLALFIAVAPAIFTTPAGARLILHHINRHLSPAATMTVDNLRIGWFTPLAIDGFHYEQTHPACTIDIPSIRSSTALLGWLPIGRANLGELRIGRPTIRTEIPRQTGNRENGSSRFFLPVWDIKVNLSIRGGTLHIGDCPDINALDATLSIDTIHSAMPFEVLCEVANGKVELKGRVDSLLDARGQANLSISRIALNQALARRLDQPPDGTLDASALLSLEGLDNLKANAELKVDDFSLSNAKPASLHLKANFHRKGNQWQLRSCQGESPWVNFAAKASGKESILHNGRARAIFSPPAIVRDFRPFLSLAPTISVPRGLINLNLVAEEQDGIIRLKANGDMPGLNILHKGKALPLSPAPTFTFATETPIDEPTKVFLRSLELTTPSITLTGNGTVSNLALEAQANLASLSSNLKAIFPALPATAGKWNIKVNSKPNGNGILLHATQRLEDFRLAQTNHPPLIVKKAESSLNTAISLGNTWSNSVLLPGSLSLNLDDSKARLTWKRAILPNANGKWQFSGISATMDASLPMLNRLISKPAGKLDGRLLFNLSAELSDTTQAFKFNSAIQQLTYKARGGTLIEPDARFSGEGIRRGNRLTLLNLTADATCAKGSIPQLSLVIPSNAKGNILQEGEANFTFDLSAVFPFLQALPIERLEGKSTLTYKGSAGLHSINLSTDNLFCTTTNDFALAERRATLSTRFRQSTNSLEIDQFNLDAQTLKSTLSGRIDWGDNGTALTLNGTLAPNLRHLTPLMTSGKDWPLVITGQSPRPLNFSCKWTPEGLLRKESLNGSGAVHISSLEFADLSAEAADLQWRLNQGILAIDYSPVVNGGRVNLSPRVNLKETPIRMRLPSKAPVAVRVGLTSQFAACWGGYVCPLLADTISAEGNFSLTVNDFVLPLDANALSNMAFDADLDIHRLSFVLGKQTSRISLISKQLERHPIETANRSLHVRCRNGIIHPDPIELQTVAATFQGNGTVGLDGHIAYELSIAPTASVLGKNLAKEFKDKPLLIPVRGSLSKLELDLSYAKRRLATAAKRILRNALENRQDLGKTIEDALRNPGELLNQLQGN
ncbi:MAG: AsmA-like C-terminal region-containing protein [Kiritimatiellia bacterium]|nr:AsmA-like C-terminal region-containing protein [Kiritimatiellia bacterium]